MTSGDDMSAAIDVAQGRAELVMSRTESDADAVSVTRDLREIAERADSRLSDFDRSTILRAADQMQLAHTILESEAMIWLVAGSHLDSAWREIVSRLANSYWDSYGNVYRPTV